MPSSPTDTTLPDNEKSTKSAGNAKGIVHLECRAGRGHPETTQLSFEFISAERCAKETAVDAPETKRGCHEISRRTSPPPTVLLICVGITRPSRSRPFTT